MCKFCEIESDEFGNYNYVGSNFEVSKRIDGKNQNFEVYLFDSPEDEGFVLQVSGVHTQLTIDINYCPMCGRKL